ncbi:MAG: multicopper oxidase family protein [Thermoplasmatota archaeon]
MGEATRGFSIFPFRSSASLVLFLFLLLCLFLRLLTPQVARVILNGDGPRPGAGKRADLCGPTRWGLRYLAGSLRYPREAYGAHWTTTGQERPYEVLQGFERVSSTRALVPLLAVLTLFAGCVSPLAQNSLSTGTGTTWNLVPPQENVKPTGHVVNIDLYLQQMTMEVYPGMFMQMWGFSLSPDPGTATVPGPTITATEGDEMHITFHNTLAGFTHTIHWHGLDVPWESDGSPYVSQDPVLPGGSYVYDFIAKPSGTFWYHCHVDNPHHIDMGMYGAFIVYPQNKNQDPPYDHEYTLMLGEMDSNHVTTLNATGQNPPNNGDPFAYANWAQQQAEYGFNTNQQVQGAVQGTPLKPNRPWWPEQYPPYDPHYDTFTINGMSFPYTQPLFIGDNETIRIRFINVGSEPHSMHLHGHQFLVTHRDGTLLTNPFWADTLTIGPGERYDVYVKGDNPGVWMLHDMASPNVNDWMSPGGMMTMLVYNEYKDKITTLMHNMTIDANGTAEIPGAPSPQAVWTLTHAPEAIPSGAFLRLYALP